MARHRKPTIRRLTVRRLLAGLALLAIAALTTAGCGAEKIAEPFKDAQRAREWSGPADTITMPDGFSNMATKCGPGQMRYTVAFHSDSPYAAISVVPDPTCPK